MQPDELIKLAGDTVLRLGGLGAIATMLIALAKGIAARVTDRSSRRVVQAVTEIQVAIQSATSTPAREQLERALEREVTLLEVYLNRREKGPALRGLVGSIALIFLAFGFTIAAHGIAIKLLIGTGLEPLDAVITVLVFTLSMTAIAASLNGYVSQARARREAEQLLDERRKAAD